MLRRLTLSAAEYSLSENRQTLSAAGLKIKVIDELSVALARKIKVLDLSSNLLPKLDNMRQFISLTEINLRDNAIRNGGQIMILATLPKLCRILIKGNPFLDEPLDEDVLQLLIEKETDIEILSGEELNRMRDLEEGELKVVFLENYLKKINCHEEILSRKSGRPYQSRAVDDQQNRNRLILTKIMPQFYSIIEDPKIQSKIKKQTLGLKREGQLTFEDAMKRRKQKQQHQVDNLIKDILLLVEEQDQERYQSRSSQKEREKIEQGMQTQGEGSFMRKRIDNVQEYEEDFESQGRWTSGNVGSPEGFRRKLNRIKKTMLINKFEEPEILAKSDERKSITPKAPSNNKPKLFIDNLFSSKNETSVFSHKMTDRFFHQQSPGSPTKGKFSESSNFYSFNRTSPIPSFQKKKILPQQSHRQFETKKQMSPAMSPILEENMRIEEFIQEETRRNHQTPKKQEEKDPIVQGQEQRSHKSAAELYDQYYVHLTKYNPAFALLYSDISTLSHEQKCVLIEALAKDHKSKSIQLFMQRLKVKTLKNSLTQNASAHEREIYNLRTEMSQKDENFKLCKKYAEQLQRENTRLGELIKVLGEDMGDLKEQNKEYKKRVGQNQKSIYKLEDKLRAKDSIIAHFAKCQEIGQQIKASREKRLKSVYLQLITKKASQNTVIQAWKHKKQQRQKARTTYICWSIMKKHLLVHMLARMKAGEKEGTVLKSCFDGWKREVEEEKRVRAKGKKMQDFLRLKALKFLRSKIFKIKAVKKQRKLSFFWADHHFAKNCFFKLRNRVKKSIALCQNYTEQSIAHNQHTILSKIFTKLKHVTKQSKNCLLSSEKTLKDSLKHKFYLQLRKLHTQNLINIEKRNKLKAITRILVYQLDDKRKIQAICSMKKQNQEVKEKSSYLSLLMKGKKFKKFIALMDQNRQQNEIKLKSKQLRKQLCWKKFRANGKKYLKKIKKIVSFFARAKKYFAQSDIKLQKKSSFLQSQLKCSKIKNFLHILTRNMYQTRLLSLQARQHLQQQQTNKLLQKMRTLESMQLAAIKTEHHKQLQLLEEEEFRKEMGYRNALMQVENGRNQLEDAVRGLRREIEDMRQRENVFFKEKELIQEQVRIAEQGKVQLNDMNENLRIEITNINNKYQRMLELYTQAMIEIEKREKYLDLMQVYEKEKEKEKEKDNFKERSDKTVEKDRRQIGGLVKNGEFTSLRNRLT